MFFTKRKIGEGKQLFLYGEGLERVESFHFLGVVFDRRLTWKNDIKQIVERCKKVLNIICVKQGCHGAPVLKHSKVSMSR